MTYAEQLTRLKTEAEKAKALEDIAKHLKSIAQDMEEIKDGMRFICERWSQR